MPKVGQLLQWRQVAPIIHRNSDLFPKGVPIDDVYIKGGDSEFRQLHTSLDGG